MRRSAIGQPIKRYRQLVWVIALSVMTLVLLPHAISTGYSFQALPSSLKAEESIVLPAPAVHPLPPSLQQWQDRNNQGDYFAAIAPTPVGYLVWSRLPVRIFVEPATSSRAGDRSPIWVESIQQALAEWTIYLPLQRVDTPTEADIAIWRRRPALRLEANAPPRARSAETRYNITVERSPHHPPILRHQVTILLRPDQSPAHLRAAARHELGHALGIWGHSPSPDDALYFAQVRQPPPISPRDVNTLKRVYQQPTRLGWELGQPHGSRN